MLISNFFQWFFGWNKKNVWKNSVLSYSLKLVDMQMLVDSLRGCLEFVFFQLIFHLFNVFHQFLYYKYILLCIECILVSNWHVCSKLCYHNIRLILLEKFMYFIYYIKTCKSVLFNLSKCTFTWSKSGKGGNEDWKVFTISF